MNVVSVPTAVPPLQPSSTASIPTTPSNRGLAIRVATTDGAQMHELLRGAFKSVLHACMHVKCVVKCFEV
jgi:hypothetical protein